MGSLPLLLRLIAASLRGQMRYPGSALMLTFGQFLATGIEVIAVWALFHRFGSVQGWQLGEVALFYGLVNIMFALADALGRGFDVLGTEFLRTGAFDRLLLRPRPLTLQLMGSDFRISRLGRLLQGLAVLGTLSFWTVESLEIANVLTYGGVQAAQYPLALYAAWFRRLLTFAVPLACVAYYPGLAILGRADLLGAPGWVGWVSPLAGFAFLALSFAAWRVGVRHYASTGS